MSAETDLASAIGQCLSAAAGIFGLGFIGWQISVARRTTDLQALQTFLRDAKEHEGALLRAKGQNELEREQAFIEFLNFMEAYAAALNGKLFPKTSRGIVVDKIVDALTLIAGLPEWHDKLEASITSHTTFSALRRFMQKHKKALADARAVRGELTRPN
ncbi:hypothetical protein QO058_30220 (plasmid) [Bosea vestrisii]|uniref:hypothetical protein n=1 Tax=Bosea vestrisii TaxID=151416 RepID=UPI0024DF4CDF|nr:hypothetical protein [Bosea vestrisii]WID99679.1 hypothetical protein QO058_30220 [Bosea vestrisii]